MNASGIEPARQQQVALVAVVEAEACLDGDRNEPGAADGHLEPDQLVACLLPGAERLLEPLPELVRLLGQLVGCHDDPTELVGSRRQYRHRVAG